MVGVRGFAIVFRAWSALLGLAVARSRRRAGSLLAVTLGVAAAAAVVLAVAPLTLVAREAAMGDALSGASVAERSLRLSVRRAGGHDGGAPQYADLGRQADDGLVGTGLAAGTARAVKWTGRATTGDRPPLVLAGVDGLAGRVRLTGGRLPRRCDASRCEVLAVAGARVPARLRLYDIRVRVVGSGKLDSAPLGPLPPPAGTLEAGSTVLVTDGVAPLLAVRELDPVPRTFTWTRLLDPAAVHPWNAGRVLDALQSAEAAFAGIVDDAQVAQPTAPLRAEAARGRAAAAFALIAAGLAATVLLAFAAFAAAEQRDDVAEELRRLRAMAARRRDLAALVVGEAAVPAFVGVALGAALAFGATALVTGVVGSLGGGEPASGRAPPRVVVRRAPTRATSARSSPPASSPPTRSSSRSPCGPRRPRSSPACSPAGQSKAVRVALEAGCLVALAALVWQAASRGQVDARTLAAGGTVDPALVLAPGAAALACGLLALRVVPPLLRGLARAAERLPVTPYLALVALARQPGRTAAAVAVVAVAGAAGTFALGHARTLQEGTLDQAAYKTAADVRGLAPSPGAKPGTDDSPVVRIEAEGLGQPLELELLGVAAQVLPRLPGWREDFSDVPIAQLAQRLDADPEGVRLKGVEIPRDARELELPVRVSGASAMLQLAIQRRDGTFGRLLPARDTRPGRATLVAPVPPADRGGTAVAFEVTVSQGGSGTSSLGEVEPGTLSARRADGTRSRLTDFADWIPATDGSFDPVLGGRRVFQYSIAGIAGYLAVRPQQPAAREPVPVLATPGLARTVKSGNLFARVPGGGQVRLRIVGRIHHMPTAPAGETAVADVGRLYAALNTQFPGLATISERWRVGDGLKPDAGRELRLAAVAAAAERDPLDPRRDRRPAHPGRPRRPGRARRRGPRRRGRRARPRGRAGRARGDRRPAENPPRPNGRRRPRHRRHRTRRGRPRRRRSHEPLPRPARARRRRPPPAAGAGARVPVDGGDRRGAARRPSHHRRRGDPGPPRLPRRHPREAACLSLTRSMRASCSWCTSRRPGTSSRCKAPAFRRSPASSWR